MFQADAMHSMDTTIVDLDTIHRLMNRLTGDEKHSSAATSTLDVVRVLYGGVLRLTPATIDDPDRDRFYLSKGHGPMAYFAVLAAHGYFPIDWLDGFAGFESPLGHHPDRNLIPGVGISSGSLGHGLPLAVGSALGLRAQGRTAHVYVLVADAELDEGSHAEAMEIASALGLGNLTAIAIDNASTSYRVPGRLAERSPPRSRRDARQHRRVLRHRRRRTHPPDGSRRRPDVRYSRRDRSNPLHGNRSRSGYSLGHRVRRAALCPHRRPDQRVVT